MVVPNFLKLCVLVISVNVCFSQDTASLLKKLVNQNEVLIDRIGLVEDELRSEKATNEVLRHRVDDLEARLGRGEKALHQAHAKRQLNTATAAFTAVITPSDLANLHGGQTVIFDRTITNMANAYDSSTGIFTAPIRGVYVFNMDIMVEPGENEYLEFVKDGAHLLYNFIHASGGLDDVSSSRTVVTELQNGGQVWIRTTKSATHGTGNLHGNEFSTFSGWLLAITE